MPRLLCKTIETFHIQDRGTIVTLEDSCDWRIPATEKIHIREAIRILRPDKSSIKTFIKGFEWLTKFGGGQACIIELPKDVLTEHVPDGSLIFLEREDDKPILWDGLKAQFTNSEQRSK